MLIVQIQVHCLIRGMKIERGYISDFSRSITLQAIYVYSTLELYFKIRNVINRNSFLKSFTSTFLKLSTQSSRGCFKPLNDL